MINVPDEILGRMLMELRGEQFHCKNGLRVGLLAEWDHLNEKGQDEWLAAARRLKAMAADEPNGTLQRSTRDVDDENVFRGLVCEANTMLGLGVDPASEWGDWRRRAGVALQPQSRSDNAS